MKAFVLTLHTPAAVGDLVSDLRCLVRHLGFRAALKEIVSRTSARAWSTVYWREIDLVMVKTLDPSTDPAASARAGFQLERMREHHGGELVRLRGGASSCDSRRRPRVLDNLRAGYQGFLVRREDEVIGHFWWIDKRIAPAHPDLATFRVQLADDEVYGFQYFIAQEHRGGGVAMDALLAMEAELAKLGFKRIWGFVDAANIPARWLYIVSGWSVEHIVRRVRLLGLRQRTLVRAAQNGQ